jgi:hypothetical protein
LASWKSFACEAARLVLGSKTFVQELLRAANLVEPINDYTIWLFNIAMENGTFLDGLPIKNSNFHGKL